MYWVMEYKEDKEDTFGAVGISLSPTRRGVREWLAYQKYHLGFGFRRVYPITRIVKLVRGSEYRKLAKRYNDLVNSF